ncbi:DUF4148 domain-containing protein [Paraburkholderia sp.]|jgi:hypothetical protein|uniref:DUF4148 domain-containing protein n=1 Tax=Paraburkholderia sp. TaxID=1926495 RepID=UPI002F3F11CA
MKKSPYLALVAALLSVPVIASAQQSTTALTRAQVRAELVQLEQTGYNPHRVTSSYPADIQAATASVRVTRDAVNYAATSPAGNPNDGASQTGGAVDLQR